jgi:hypothetical protein
VIRIIGTRSNFLRSLFAAILIGFSLSPSDGSDSTVIQLANVILSMPLARQRPAARTHAKPPVVTCDREVEATLTPSP